MNSILITEKLSIIIIEFGKEATVEDISFWVDKARLSKRYRNFNGIKNDNIATTIIITIKNEEIIFERRK